MNISGDILKSLEKIFRHDPNITLAYIFGSQISGFSHKNSDLDLAVVASDPLKVNYQSLYSRLIRIVPEYEIDLRIITNKSLPLFLFEVLKNGKCIYKKNEDERISFETKVLKDFYDTQHIRHIYDSYLKQTLREGTYGHK